MFYYNFWLSLWAKTSGRFLPMLLFLLYWYTTFTWHLTFDSLVFGAEVEGNFLLLFFNLSLRQALCPWISKVEYFMWSFPSYPHSALFGRSCGVEFSNCERFLMLWSLNTLFFLLQELGVFSTLFSSPSCSEYLPMPWGVRWGPRASYFSSRALRILFHKGGRGKESKWGFSSDLQWCLLIMEFNTFYHILNIGVYVR